MDFITASFSMKNPHKDTYQNFPQLKILIGIFEICQSKKFLQGFLLSFSKNKTPLWTLSQFLKVENSYWDFIKISQSKKPLYLSFTLSQSKNHIGIFKKILKVENPYRGFYQNFPK